MNTLESYIPIVEAAIEKMGLPLNKARTEDPLQWAFHRGSAKVLLILRMSEGHKGSRGVLIILSPIIPLPKDETLRNKVAQFLLELNHRLVAESFSFADNGIFLSTGRFLDGMDSNEVADLLDGLSWHADWIDDQLKAKFEEAYAQMKPGKT